MEFSLHLVAKYSLVKQRESVQHRTNENVDGAYVYGQKWKQWLPRSDSFEKNLKIQWVYIVEIEGTWVQIPGMALSRVFFVIGATLEATNVGVRTDFFRRQNVEIWCEK